MAKQEHKHVRPIQNEHKAIGYMVISTVTGAIVAATIKSLSALMSPVVAFSLSRFFPLLGLIPMAMAGKLKHLKTHHFKEHLVLNLIYIASILIYFYSLAFIPLVNASLFFNTAPLFTPVIAALFLKEHFPKRLWFYVAISLIGVILVLQPRSDLFQPISLLALLAGFLMAVAQVLNRNLSHHEPPERIVFYMIILAPVLGLVPVIIDPFLVMRIDMPKEDYLLVGGKLLMAGFCTWLYQLYRSKSAAHGRVGVVMPFSFLGVVFAGTFDWLFWGVIPNYLTIIGVVLIFTGSLFILKNSNKVLH